ncbi:MAG: phosphoribosyltransferase family protein [Longimicrobiales bacterium]|nr:phosphoribosyltransferase family protein [Longimicrobiales bacterium]
MDETHGFLIADAGRIASVLDRLARRVHATLGSELRLIGIQRRGDPLARRLAERLSVLAGTETEMGTLKLKRYADDLTVLNEDPQLSEAELPFPVDGADLLVVDDVLYSGRTFLKAVGHLEAAGAGSIHLCALCSRGENDVPMRADFVGLQLDVGEGNVVEVHAPPYEEAWGVRLVHREDLAEEG